MKNDKPKILLIDIETSPIISYTWGLFDQNIALNQIVKDWHLLSFSAKWLDVPGQKKNKVIYMDQSKEKNIEDDRKLLKAIWKLLDEADIVVGQNSKAFDIKKISARFLLNSMPPPSPFEQIDTLVIARRRFAMTSNKLEFLTNKLCTKYKKSGHKKFAGFELWKECLKGNKAAWAEMRHYNVMDVLSLEELFNKLQPWAKEANYMHYNGDVKCACGNRKLQKHSFAVTKTGKFQRFKCTDCGSVFRDKVNLREKGFNKKLLTKE